MHLDWPEPLLQTDSCRPVGALLPPPPPTAPPTPGGLSLKRSSRRNQPHQQQLHLQQQSPNELSSHGGSPAQGQGSGRLQAVGLGGGGGREAALSLTSGSWRLSAALAGGDGDGGASAGEIPRAGQANACAGSLGRLLSHQHLQLHNNVVAALQSSFYYAATASGMEGLAAGSSNAGAAVGRAPLQGAVRTRPGLPSPAVATGVSPDVHAGTFSAAATAAAAAAANSQFSRPFHHHHHHHHNQHSYDSTRASLVGGSSRATPTTFRSSTFNTMPSDLLHSRTHPDHHHHSRTYSASSLTTQAGGRPGGSGMAVSDAHAHHATAPFAVATAQRRQTGSAVSPRPSTEGTLLSSGHVAVVAGLEAQGSVSPPPARGLHRLSASALPVGSPRTSMEAAAVAAWPAPAAPRVPPAAAAASSALTGALWCAVDSGTSRLEGT